MALQVKYFLQLFCETGLYALPIVSAHLGSTWGFKIPFYAPVFKILLAADLFLTGGTFVSVSDIFPVYNPTKFSGGYHFLKHSNTTSNELTRDFLWTWGFSFHQYLGSYCKSFTDQDEIRNIRQGQENLNQKLFITVAAFYHIYLWLVFSEYIRLPSSTTVFRRVLKFFKTIAWCFLGTIQAIFRKLTLSGGRKRKTSNLSEESSENSSAKRVNPKWFHHSCLYGHKDNVKRIIQEFKDDLNPNEMIQIGDGESTSENSPLHLACIGGHFSIVQIILSNFEGKLDFGLRNSDGLSLLDLCIKNGLKDITMLLLKAKKFKPPTLKDLLASLEEDKPEIVKLLFEKVREKEANFDHVFKEEMEKYLTSSREASKEENSASKKHASLRKVTESKTILVNTLKVKIKLNELLENMKKEQQQQQQQNNSDLDKTPEDAVNESIRDENDIKARVIEEYDCPVCLELMSAPKHIFACSNDHMLCSDCLKNNRINNCPICREDFQENEPKRRRLYEKLARNFLPQK